MAIIKSLAFYHFHFNENKVIDLTMHYVKLYSLIAGQTNAGITT